MSPARIRRGACCLALLLLGSLGATASAQYRKGDPRYVKDPREVSDPRTVRDPRTVDRDPRALPSDQELFDHHLATDNVGELRVAMRENPWIVMKWIDGFCQRWLAIVDADGTPGEQRQAEVALLQEQGRLVARLADGAFGDTRFSLYVDGVFRWTPEQRTLYLERERLTQQGLDVSNGAITADDARRALTPLTQALEYARRLGDTPGMSSTLAAMGRVQWEGGYYREARATMGEAVRIGRQVRDYDAIWAALSMLYEGGMEHEEYGQAQRALRDQYLIARDSGAPGAAEQILVQLVELELYLDDRDRLAPPSVRTPGRPGREDPGQLGSAPR